MTRIRSRSILVSESSMKMLTGMTMQAVKMPMLTQSLPKSRLKATSRKRVMIPKKMYFLVCPFLGALAVGVGAAFAAGCFRRASGNTPNGSPEGPMRYLFFCVSKSTTVSTVKRAAIRNPHLKSSGLPVSPKRPQTMGARKDPTLTPI